ncbi:MAG: ATP-dependent sacrificial sulfur transferase LarE [Acidimicrobiia bacterium]
MTGPDELDALRARLRSLDRVVVAFSGGADSAFLAWVANDELGPERAHAVTAVSPSLAPEEEADCKELAAEWGLRWTSVVTDELADADYRRNDGDRCYHCKTELMAAVGPIADAEGAVVVLGVNLDDLGDHRPGQRAAAERGAVFPLVDAGFTKDRIRARSQALGLRTWDKPAAACLASRVPYGTPVTLSVLAEVAAAESALRALGFRQLRVRHYGDLARLEVPVDALAEVVERRVDVVGAVRSAGYRYVTLDLEGFRSGNLNAALGGPG